MNSYEYEYLRAKHSSLFCMSVRDEKEKKGFMTLSPAGKMVSDEAGQLYYKTFYTHNYFFTAGFTHYSPVSASKY